MICLQSIRQRYHVKKSLLLLQLLGIIYLPNKNSNWVLNKITEYSWGAIQSTIIIFLWGCFLISIKNYNYFNENKVTKACDILMMSTIMLHLTARNVSNISHKVNILKLLNVLKEIRLRFKKNFENSYNLIYGILVFNVVLSSLYLYILKATYGWIAVTYGLVHNTNNIGTQAEIYFIYQTMNNIRKNFHLLNKQLIFISHFAWKRNWPVNVHKIVDMIKLYNEINETAKLANKVFQVPVITLCIYNMIAMVDGIFYGTVCVMKIFRDGINNESLVSLIFPIWIPFHLFNILCIIKPWVSTSNEAKKTAIYIHNIWNKHAGQTLIDPNLSHLRLISLQLLNTQLNFTACGFFSLDWTLLHAIIGAVTSYVVIFIQFERMN